MAKTKYTPEMVQFIRDYAPGHWVKEIVAAVKEKFGIEFTELAIRSALDRFGVRTGVKQRRGCERFGDRLTTLEQDELVREKFHEKKCGSYKDVQTFLESLGVSFTIKQVKSYLNRRKIRLGTYGYFKKGHIPANKGMKVSPEVYARCKPTMFRKGNIPVNNRPVGSERVNVDGYVEIKIGEPNKWQIKGRYVWEQATGEKLDRNESVIYLDGNKQNLEISNLAKVTRSQLARLNQNHLIYNNQELTRVGITLAKLLDMKGRLKK